MWKISEMQWATPHSLVTCYLCKVYNINAKREGEIHPIICFISSTPPTPKNTPSTTLTNQSTKPQAFTRFCLTLTMKYQLQFAVNCCNSVNTHNGKIQKPKLNIMYKPQESKWLWSTLGTACCPSEWNVKSDRNWSHINSTASQCLCFFVTEGWILVRHWNKLLWKETNSN